MLFGIIIAALIALDRVSKILMTNWLGATPSYSYPLIPGILHLTYTQNYGAAFGILENFRWFFVALAAVVTVIAVYYLYKNRRGHKLFTFSLCLLISGTVGNLIDRMLTGYVVDFFEFRFVRFAIFNVADTCLVFGTILLCCYFLFTPAGIALTKGKAAAETAESADSGEGDGVGE